MTGRDEETNGESSGEGPPSGGSPEDPGRRRVLGYAGLAALAGGGVAGAWYLSRPAPAPASGGEDGADENGGDPENDGDPADEDALADAPAEIPAVVSRYAPDLYFGALEKWYPTDPRPYVVETDEGAVVDGFTALDEYSAAFRETGSPPAPTVFYNVVEAAPGVDAVQYWLYSAFDQFTVNFHWHDWELLQVFVDRESGDPLLLSASAHSRASPNNEFLDPEIPDGSRPGILSEVGSHSSASEVNGLVPSFERLPVGDLVSDVTNDAIDVSASLRAPFAYGLPRDEGARLPFVLPELDGAPLHEHPSLSIERTDLIDERVTVGSWRGLPTPPEDLPLREPGLVLAHPDSAVDADATYALEPLSPLGEAIDGFVGPQLSFEFAVPGFAEDVLASHITSVGTPWEQERFADPLSDVTDPAHRRRIDGSEPDGLTNRVAGRVRQLRAGTGGTLDGVTDGAADAVTGVAGVSLFPLSTELAVRLASEDPTATVTRGGVFEYLRVEPGPHLLVANGPGIAPIASRFTHDGGLVRVGGDGDLAVVASGDAGWIRGDAREADGVERVRVVEDYAGVVYEGAPVETDRFAVAVHREGRYTVEVVDRAGATGAYRVTPDSFDENGEAVRERVETGKAALARTLRGELDELYALAESLSPDDDDADDTPENGTAGETDRDRNGTASDPVLDGISRARESAAGAVAAAENDEERAADDRLSAAASALWRVRDAFATDDQAGYDDGAVEALDPKALAGIERANDAIDAPL
ncbi:hypothetical protein C471_03983 [Halorubrum saccharovorum DSM 1137]|uniref:Uncharacterized protein n=1 Tax=Halorubrum saccharovorum DSM 1137 TaxID=1227484 RepID=M0E6B4_9EURY|nr:hypothetical protein [Halorubrum saccharovorum]ELZ42588.1 hypothetical protein C471_03983 [Halorubrum saccharovorum DSM 1137]